MLNVMNIVGNVTRVDKRSFQNNGQTMVAYNFGIAVNEGYGEQQKTTFYNAVLYSNTGKQEEFMDKKITVGNKLPFSGRMMPGKPYTDKNGSQITPWIFHVNAIENGINTVVLSGRLTSDASVSVLDQGKMVARFTLAVDRYNGGTDFIRCVKWGKQGSAEKLFDYLKQGRQVAICGRETTGSYTNKDGQKVYTQEITVRDLELYGTKPQNNAAPSVPQNDTGMGNMNYQENIPGNDGFMNIPDGTDIPFGDEELPFSC